MTTARSQRHSTQLPTAPNVGDTFLKTDDPQPFNICVTPGIFTALGPALNVDTFSESFHPGPSGTHYAGGFYDFAASDNDFNPGVNFGVVNESHGSHVFLVAAAGAGGGDTTVRVTGTSIDDAGIRTPADTEDLVLDDAGAAGAFYETANRWLGQVTIAKQGGPDLLANFGFSMYFTRGGGDFFVRGLDIGWVAGASDSGFDLKLLRHTTSGWTYNPGSEPTPAAPVLSLQASHGVEHDLVNGRPGGWRLAGLSIPVAGSAGEGVLLEITTTTNNALDSGRASLVVSP